MDLRPQSPSLVEVVLARMRKREESPWGRVQMLGHRWLTRLERNRLIRSYHTLLRRRPSTIGLRSGPAIDIDSSFFLSLLFHLLLLILLSWMTLSSRPESKPGPIRVRFLDVARQVQRKPAKPLAKRSSKPSPKPSKLPEKKPAVVVPKPPPPLPTPKVLAQAPKEEAVSLVAESAEALIRLPTRQSGADQTPQLKVKNIPDVTVDTALSLPTPQGLEKLPNEEMASLTRLPTRQSGTDQAPQLKVETTPLTAVTTVSEDEIKVPKELFRGEGPPAGTGNPSAFSSPDFAPYLETIKRRVQSVWEYPEGVSGVHRVNLVFVLDRGGKVVRVEVLDPENSKLDRSAMLAMKRASPFPPIPDSLKDLAGWPLRIRFTIDFGVKVAR